MKRTIVPEDHPLQEDDCERFLLDDDETDSIIAALITAANLLGKVNKASYSPETKALCEQQVRNWFRIAAKMQGEG